MPRKYLLLSIICLFIASLSVCQRVRINGIEGDRPLLWDDFTGKSDKNTSIFAYTYWKLEYKTNSIHIKVIP